VRPGGAVILVAAAAIGALALAGAGCGPDVVVNEELLKKSAPKTVAVLPFTAAKDLGGERARLKVDAIRQTFHRRFRALPYLHLDLDVTDRLLEQSGVKTAEQAAAARFAQIQKTLGVDAFVRGEITALGDFKGGVLYRLSIGGKIALIDARTGQELAHVEHTEADTGGLLLQTGALVEGIQQTMDNFSDLGFVRLAEKFANEVVKPFPKPPVVPEVVQPNLKSARLAVRGGGAAATQALAAGDVIEATVEADPNLYVTLQLGTDLSPIPLAAERPGVYRGAYRVARGDRFAGRPTVRLRDRFGVTAAKVLDEIRVDARPPAAPRGLEASAKAGIVRLKWSPPEGASPPPPGYRVYGLDDRRVPTLLLEVKETEALVPAGSKAYAVGAIGANGLLGPFVVWGLPPSGTVREFVKKYATEDGALKKLPGFKAPGAPR